MDRSSGNIPAPLPPPVEVSLTVLPPVKCPYLPGRMETAQAIRAGEVDPMIYQAFMDAGFRRSGKIIYQPICQNCRECVPIRLPIDEFHPSKSQRRALHRNADIAVTADSNFMRHHLNP